jgi:serine/threonine-protein kinase
VLSVLHVANQHGVIHRDIKPENLFLADVIGRPPLVKVLDFGIASADCEEGLTGRGSVVGTPAYMSPEQVLGDKLDARSDIFSLGVVLFEALTGVAPFDGDNVNAIMYATVNTSPPPPSQHNRTVPAMLDLIVAKAMAKLLEDRYQTVKELADDLREVRRQMDSSRPATALKASNVPSAPRKPVPIIDRAVDTSTMPIAPPQERPTKEDERPVPLNKTFDSFDATLRLAAMTDQTEDFREYISQTQKMRAYKGKIEGPHAAKLVAQSAAPPPPPPVAERKPVVTPRPLAPQTYPQRGMQMPEPTTESAGATNVIAVLAIVVLAAAAVALTVALLMK